MDMDIENLESWMSRLDVCRCCLSASGSKNLLDAYINENGEKEAYSDLLHKCFGISFSLPESPGGQMVCDLCIGRLHETEVFRKQVILAEEYFRSYITKKIPEHNIAEHEDIDLSHEELGLGDLDEDRSHPKYPEFPVIVDKHSENPCVADDTTNKGLQLIPAVKKVSERKKIKITCEGVIRNTTACPFRHYRSWFQCFFCTQTFIEITPLRQHTLETHPNLDDELKKLKRHPRSFQIDITELKCRNCDLSLSNTDSMIHHLHEMHSLWIYKEFIADYKVNSSPYSCHLCTKQFHVFRSLTIHLNEHYANYICDVCGKSYINSKRLKVHNRTHETGSFPCPQCGVVLHSQSAKANHLEKHSKRVIKCQICSKPLKHYNDRVKHMSEVHNITHKFKCTICSREYNIKHYLTTHMRQTHGHRNKKCGECGMSFITNQRLKKHLLKHTGFKAFVCEICNTSYGTSYSLKEHRRVHER